MPGASKHNRMARPSFAPSGLSPVAPQPARAPRVLCIDDEPAMLAILTRALGSQFEIVTLDDPIAALSLLERSGDFSVVISDMKMPQMDGADFLARVRSIAPATARLALTACLERELSTEEVFGILTKPCPLNLLHESVAAAIQHNAMLLRKASLEGAPGRQELSRLSTELPCDAMGSGVRRGGAEEDSDVRALAPAVIGQGVPASADAALYLQLLGRYVPLGPRATFLGRASDCEVVVNDPRLSPRHVRFFNSWRGVTIQDVSRTNDVRVNGDALTGVRHIKVGDWITFGPFHAEVRSQRDVDASIGPVASPRPRLDRALRQERPLEAGGCPLTILGTVAEKLFLLRQPAEAERLLRPRLEELARACREGQPPTEDDFERAITLATRLATQLRSPRWIDYVLEAFMALRRPLGAHLVELLHDLMRQVPGASLCTFREYLSVLKATQHELKPAEQFLIRRIEGLEPLIAP